MSSSGARLRMASVDRVYQATSMEPRTASRARIRAEGIMAGLGKQELVAGVVVGRRASVGRGSSRRAGASQESERFSPSLLAPSQSQMSLSDVRTAARSELADNFTHPRSSARFSRSGTITSIAARGVYLRSTKERTENIVIRYKEKLDDASIRHSRSCTLLRGST